MPKIAMNYANTILYKIQHDTDDRLTYIGNTTSFKQRKALHKRCCERGDTSSKLYAMIRENGGWSSFRMTPIKEYPCKSYHDAVMEEDRLRHEMNIPPYISKSTIDTPIIPLKQTVLKPEPSHTCYENVIKTVILEDTLNQPNTPQNFIIPTSPTLPTAIPDNTAIIPDNTAIIPTDVMPDDDVLPVLKLNKWKIKTIPIPDDTSLKKKVTYIEEERGLREQYLRNLLKKKSPNKKYKRNLTLKKGW